MTQRLPVGKTTAMLPPLKFAIYHSYLIIADEFASRGLENCFVAYMLERLYVPNMIWWNWYVTFISHAIECHYDCPDVVGFSV